MGEVTAPELARRLRVDAVALRRWLRDLADRRHPLTASHERYARWRFSNDEADALSEMFRSQRTRGTRPNSGRDLLVRFNGFEPAAAPFDEFLAFLEALFDVYRLADVRGSTLAQPPIPSLRRIKAGSPVDLEWVFEAVRDSPATVAAIAIAIQQLAKALNEVLDGRARRKLIASQAAASDRRSRAEVVKLEAETRAATEESRARVAKIEAETRAIEATQEPTLAIDAVPAIAKPPLIMDDPDLLLREVAFDTGSLSDDALHAVAVLQESPIEVDIVTIRWARRRRRTR